MAASLKTVSPVDNSVYVEREFADTDAVERALALAVEAQRAWRRTPVGERAAICTRAVDAFVARKQQIGEEIAWQMGRPLAQTPGEVNGFEERARYMIGAAESALADVQPEAKPGFTRFIRRVPLGVVFTVAPWNYPYLTAVNSIVPAIMAGNAVIVKHSAQTPLCAERMYEAFREAGLPDGVFAYLHLTHAVTERVIGDRRIDFVAFTGSVAGGHMVQRAAASRFVGSGLELGGKDPAYVRADADLEHAVATVVDGAFFNAGQSCCGIERAYVAAAIFDDFVDAAVAEVNRYVLGDPLQSATTLGPMVRLSAAEAVRAQTAEAVAAGARALIDPGRFPAAAEGTPYLAPQLLIDVDHSMRVMSQETFGPLLGMMPVRNDREAIELMNDSDYGLTAAVFTQDTAAALDIGEQINTGTWFMNRCDYLDPALAWTGVKDSGRGCTLSRIGYEHLTRPKSYHLKTAL